MMSTIDNAEFERMADLVRRDDPALTRIQLAPDGKYQTRTASLDSLTGEVTECLAEGFRRRGSNEFPTFYSGWGRCRVGSTALDRKSVV